MGSSSPSQWRQVSAELEEVEELLQTAAPGSRQALHVRMYVHSSTYVCVHPTAIENYLITQAYMYRQIHTYTRTHAHARAHRLQRCCL